MSISFTMIDKKQYQLYYTLKLELYLYINLLTNFIVLLLYELKLLFLKKIETLVNKQFRFHLLKKLFFI